MTASRNATRRRTIDQVVDVALDQDVSTDETVTRKDMLAALAGALDDIVVSADNIVLEPTVSAAVDAVIAWESLPFAQRPVAAAQAAIAAVKSGCVKVLDDGRFRVGFSTLAIGLTAAGVKPSAMLIFPELKGSNTFTPDRQLHCIALAAVAKLTGYPPREGELPNVFELRRMAQDKRRMTSKSSH